MRANRLPGAVPQAKADVAPLALAGRQICLRHEIIDVSFIGMTESIRQRSNDFEPEVLPKTDRSGICGNHIIELHRAKTKPTRFAQAMLGHRATDPLPPSTR